MDRFKFNISELTIELLTRYEPNTQYNPPIPRWVLVINIYNENYNFACQFEVYLFNNENIEMLKKKMPEIIDNFITINNIKDKTSFYKNKDILRDLICSHSSNLDFCCFNHYIPERYVTDRSCQNKTSAPHVFTSS